jgi:ribosomal protein L32E
MRERKIGKASSLYEYREIHTKRKFNFSGESYHRYKLNQYQWRTPILDRTDFNLGNGENDDLGVLGYQNKVMMDEYLRVTS